MNRLSAIEEIEIHFPTNGSFCAGDYSYETILLDIGPRFTGDCRSPRALTHSLTRLSLCPQDWGQSIHSRYLCRLIASVPSTRGIVLDSLSDGDYDDSEVEEQYTYDPGTRPMALIEGLTRLRNLSLESCSIGEGDESWKSMRLRSPLRAIVARGNSFLGIDDLVALVRKVTKSIESITYECDPETVCSFDRESRAKEREANLRAPFDSTLLCPRLEVLDVVDLADRCVALVRRLGLLDRGCSLEVLKLDGYPERTDVFDRPPETEARLPLINWRELLAKQTSLKRIELGGTFSRTGAQSHQGPALLAAASSSGVIVDIDDGETKGSDVSSDMDDDELVAPAILQAL